MAAAIVIPRCVGAPLMPCRQPEEHADSGDETTPTTSLSECSEPPRDDEDWDCDAPPPADEAEAPERQLGPGLFHEDAAERGPAPPSAPPVDAEVAARPLQRAGADVGAAGRSAPFTREETLFVFDWDDTILPSSWIQSQGLRLDAGSVVCAWQRARLAEVAAAAGETLRLAKLCGTVVLLTNAERGWIELSCLKFLPELLPVIEGIKIVSARTTYERPDCAQPLQWKLRAFEAEIARACGAEALADPARRKNIHSLGDSVHEREALLRATVGAPNCCWKSLKFVDRPDIWQLLSQHATVVHSFDQVVQHDGNLDLTLSCS